MNETPSAIPPVSAMIRLVALCMAAAITAGCATQSPSARGTEVTIRYASIVSVSRVPLPSAAPAGAIVGGFTGLALSHRASTGGRVAAGVGGAALGTLATRALEGDRLGYSYRLRFLDDSESDFVTEKGYLRVDDCVAMESGSHKNLRRGSAIVCDSRPAVRSSVAMHQSNAEQCHQAKEQLLIAQGNAAINDAAREVEIICHF